jgi:hypothetical protein
MCRRRGARHGICVSSELSPGLYNGHAPGDTRGDPLSTRGDPLLNVEAFTTGTRMTQRGRRETQKTISNLKFQMAFTLKFEISNGLLVFALKFEISNGLRSVHLSRVLSALCVFVASPFNHTRLSEKS